MAPSSSGSPPAAPAFSSRSWNHDVLLSFKGNDARNTFVDHLHTALVQQRIVILVFSKHYADSSWCLGAVDLSELRKQKQKYEKAFLKHELESKNKSESWRKALVDSGNVSGWETKHIANGHEAKGIKEIVDTIS